MKISQSIPRMVDALARASKMLKRTTVEIANHLDEIQSEAKHYGIPESKIKKLTLRELMNEINRRRDLALTSNFEKKI